MVREIVSADVDPAEPRWPEIQAALEQVAELSSTNISSAEFYAVLVERAASVLGALAGAVWLRSADGAWRREAEWQFPATSLEQSRESSAAHLQLLEAARAQAEPSVCRPGRSLELLHAPGLATKSAPRATNPTQLTLVFCPLRLAPQSVGLIEIVYPQGASLAAERADVPLLTALGELATDFQRHERLRDFAAREGHWLKFEQFVQAAHASLDLHSTAQAIVNEGRRLIGCDRLSLLTVKGRKCRLIAVSGLEEVERRGNLVQRSEDLARCVLRYREPLWYPAQAGDPADSLPADLRQALDSQLDQSHARMLAAIPLEPAARTAKADAAPEPIGVLLVEQFERAQVDPDAIARSRTVARHATSALTNALDYDSLPLITLERGLQRLRWLTRARQLPKTLITLAVLLAVVLALALVPADFAIEARGELQPRTRREVFAPSDAIVAEIRVAERRDVRAGDVLVTLRRPQLEFELHRVLGEAQTARKRLAGIQAARLGPERGKTDTTQRYNQLTADEEEVKELLGSLAQQEQILRQQQAELILTSPIDGQVLTWDVEQLLASRPVQRGQVLLTVGELAGPWQLELRLPDDHAGYVLEAQQTAADPLDVDFLLATDPGTPYRGQIEKTALAAQTDEVYGPHVLVTVAIDRDAVASLRPGASVIGKIHCGRRSIGFVWFHDLISVIRRRLLF